MVPVRKILNECINPHDNLYVLLSSGLDSQSILYSCLELKKSITVVSFRIDGVYSTDFRCAKKLADMNNLEFIEVVLPTDISQLSKDILYMANVLGCKKKTDFECIFPFLYVYKRLSGKALISGMGADVWYLLSKSAMINHRSNPDAFREKNYARPDFAQRCYHSDLCKRHEASHLMPFMDKVFFDAFKGKSWDELNRPKQKNDIRTQYPELRSGLHFKHTNLQKGDSQIASVFEKLLDTEWNNNNYKSVTGIYNAVVNGYIKNPLED